QFSGGCSNAYSLNNVVVSGYAGKLFQVDISGVTTDIGATAGAVDLALVQSTCGTLPAVATCRLKNIYDQAGSCDLVAPDASHEGYLAQGANGALIALTTSGGINLEAQACATAPGKDAAKSVILLGSNTTINGNGYGEFGLTGHASTNGGT